jgi:hypothetical protein
MAGSIAPGSGLSTGQTLGILLTSPDPFRTFIEAQNQNKQQGAINQAAQAFTNPNLVTENNITLDKSLMNDPNLFDQAKVNAMQPAPQQARARMALERLAEGAPEIVAKGLVESALPNYKTIGRNIVDVNAANGPSVVYQGPMELPTSIQEALFVSNGDPEAAKTVLRNKGMDGEWVLGPGGRTQYVPKSMLLDPANAGAYSKIPTGMKIVSDGQGGFTMATGDMAAGSGLTTPNQTALQSSVLASQDSVARLEAIGAKFKPEYQELGTRWTNLANATKEKVGFKLEPQAQQQLEEFTSYRRDVTANTNKIIKDLTGATVGVDEAPRLMLEMPVAGQGLFDGDSPTEFEAKRKGTIASLKAANIRNAYALKNGLNKDQQFAIPLSTIPNLVNSRGAELAQQLKRENPTAPEDQINAMVKARMRMEFGLE